MINIIKNYKDAIDLICTSGGSTHKKIKMPTRQILKSHIVQDMHTEKRFATTIAIQREIDDFDIHHHQDPTESHKRGVKAIKPGQG